MLKVRQASGWLALALVIAGGVVVSPGAAAGSGCEIYAYQGTAEDLSTPVWWEINEFEQSVGVLVPLSKGGDYVMYTVANVCDPLVIKLEMCLKHSAFDAVAFNDCTQES